MELIIFIGKPMDAALQILYFMIMTAGIHCRCRDIRKDEKSNWYDGECFVNKAAIRKALMKS
jgi:hypothetical protein